MRERLASPARSALDERFVTEDSAKFRTPSQRDRDRVLYSTAFHRLGGITQVASPAGGHVFHSRLTHSLKVAQVARRLCERLRMVAGNSSELAEIMDPDAVEAAALAHDIGHPPFGHLAEEVLSEKAGSIGGFEGNAQTFRILTRLSSRAVESSGLNLTRRVLNGTIKYPVLLRAPSFVERLTRSRPRSPVKGGAYEDDEEHFEWARDGSHELRSLEAVLMDWADDVTYGVHDMDDFYRAGLIPLEQLRNSRHDRGEFCEYMASRHRRDADALRDAAERLFSKSFLVSSPYRGVLEDRISLRAVGSLLITRYINAVQVSGSPRARWWVEIPDPVRYEVKVLKELTWRYVIERPSLAILQKGQRRVISELFDAYAEDAEAGRGRLFPPAYAERLEDATRRARLRTVVDLVASLTEEAAWEIHRRITGVGSGSVADAFGVHA